MPRQATLRVPAAPSKASVNSGLSGAPNQSGRVMARLQSVFKRPMAGQNGNGAEKPKQSMASEADPERGAEKADFSKP